MAYGKTSLNNQVLRQYVNEASELKYVQHEHDLYAVVVKERRCWQAYGKSGSLRHWESM